MIVKWKITELNAFKVNKKETKTEVIALITLLAYFLNT